MNKKYFLITALCFAFISGLNAQLKTNIDVFYTLIDSSANEFISHIPQETDSINLELNLGENYSIFENKIVARIYSSGKFITKEANDAVSVNYIIENTEVTYGDIYRDGLFGSYYIPRNITLKGNYLVKNNSHFYQEFNYFSNDTISYDDINIVENESYPFTKGDIPSEPFFSGLFEPVVAIGTAALAVVLFFTIRSK
jgi:hypothetical protein